jgi:hypothetical protein
MGETAYSLQRSDLGRIGCIVAERLADHKDLRFFKLGVIWSSDETPDLVTAFRKRTGLDVGSILRRSVVAKDADVKDWAALFSFALAFGWDAAVTSRGARGLVWFSHDEFLRATPPLLIRGI